MFNILKGNINMLLGLNLDIVSPRLAICKKCPLYYKGTCNDLLWLNPKTNKISKIKKEGYFNGCGCLIKAKASIPNEECPAGKW